MFLMDLDQINLCAGWNWGEGKVRVIVKLCPAILTLMWVRPVESYWVRFSDRINDQFSWSFLVIDLRLNDDKGASIAIIHSWAPGHRCWRNWSHCDGGEELSILVFPKCCIEILFLNSLCILKKNSCFVDDIFESFELYPPSIFTLQIKLLVYF